MGHRPRGLQRRRNRLGLLPARPRPLACLPVGRGRPRRDLGQPSATLLRPGALERSGSDPEGTALRPDQSGGQPRRGREGMLFLPRRHPDPLLHEVSLQVPAGRLPVHAPGRGEPPSGPKRPGVRAARYRRLRRRSVLRRARRVREGDAGRHPDPDHRHQPGPGGGRAAPPAHAVVPEHVVLGTRGEAAPPPRRTTARRGDGHRGGPRLARPAVARVRGTAGSALHRERDESSAARRGTQPGALREGRDRRLRRPRLRGSGEPRATRDEGGRPVPGDDRIGRDRGPPTPSRIARPPGTRSEDGSTRSSRSGWGRPTSSMPR